MSAVRSADDCESLAHTRAWIETTAHADRQPRRTRSLAHTRAWIETIDARRPARTPESSLAHTRAWIETVDVVRASRRDCRRSLTRGRGLKRLSSGGVRLRQRSLAHTRAWIETSSHRARSHCRHASLAHTRAWIETIRRLSSSTRPRRSLAHTRAWIETSPASTHDVAASRRSLTRGRGLKQSSTCRPSRGSSVARSHAGVD